MSALQQELQAALLERDRLRAERDGQREENAKLRQSIEENLDRLRAENERLRERLGELILAVKDVKNGNVTLGEFIDCANWIFSRATEQDRSSFNDGCP